jgi:hypothetical protein
MTGSPPAVPQFATGYGYLPSDFDNLIQVPLTFLTTGIIFRAEQHAGQALTGGSNTVIQYNTILEDPYAGWSATAYTYTVPYTGWYEITVTGTMTVTGTPIEVLIKTPESTISGGAHPVLASYPGMASCSQTLPLTGGEDTVQGVTLVSTSTNTNTVNGRYSTIEISFVSQ